MNLTLGDPTETERGCTSGEVYVPCNLLALQVRVTVGDSVLCCCVCVMSFEH